VFRDNRQQDLYDLCLEELELVGFTVYTQALCSRGKHGNDIAILCVIRECQQNQVYKTYLREYK
jgi:hypothetical protein